MTDFVSFIADCLLIIVLGVFVPATIVSIIDGVRERMGR